MQPCIAGAHAYGFRLRSARTLDLSAARQGAVRIPRPAGAGQRPPHLPQLPCAYAGAGGAAAGHARRGAGRARAAGPSGRAGGRGGVAGLRARRPGRGAGGAAAQRRRHGHAPPARHRRQLRCGGPVDGRGACGAAGAAVCGGRHGAALAAAGAGRQPWGAGGSDSTSGTAGPAARTAAVPAVHIRFDRLAARRHGHPRQRDRQRPRHAGPCTYGRLLAAAASRHGPDRLLPFPHRRRRQQLRLCSGRLPAPPGAVAAPDRGSGRHLQLLAQFWL